MYPHEEDKLDRHFIEAWKEWSGRSPRLSPKQAAAQVRSRLGYREARHPGWLYAAAAVVMLSLSAGTTYLWISGGPPVPPPSSMTQQMAPLSEGEVLMWLDDKTPLYMNFQSPRGPRVQ
jgi:hypothetical protein